MLPDDVTAEEAQEKTNSENGSFQTNLFVYESPYDSIMHNTCMVGHISLKHMHTHFECKSAMQMYKNIIHFIMYTNYKIKRSCNTTYT